MIKIFHPAQTTSYRAHVNQYATINKKKNRNPVRKKAYRFKAKWNMSKVWEGHGMYSGMLDPKNNYKWRAGISFSVKSIYGCNKSLHSGMTKVLESWAICEVLKILVDNKQNKTHIVPQPKLFRNSLINIYRQYNQPLLDPKYTEAKNNTEE